MSCPVLEISAVCFNTAAQLIGDVIKVCIFCIVRLLACVVL